MKKSVMFMCVLTCLLWSSVECFGQYYVDSACYNLVPNPSFEDARACPKSADYIGGVVAWNLFPYLSADYFNRCANYYQRPDYKSVTLLEEIENFSVPNSMFGYQEPHSGNGYAGLSLCAEALSVKLKRPMVKDSLYFVEFFVSLTNASNVATRTMGMYISRSAIRTQTDFNGHIERFIMEEPPQVNARDFLTDTAAWMPVVGLYHAKGGEQYITIGGLYPCSDTSLLPIREKRDVQQFHPSEKFLGYYLIDDVSVTPFDPKWSPKTDIPYIMEHVYFKPLETELLPESLFAVELLRDYLFYHSEINVTITGHTDNLLSESYNLTRSKRRAEAIARYLTEHQIDAHRITCVGAGSSHPLADNSEADGRLMNERIEFTLH